MMAEVPTGATVPVSVLTSRNGEANVQVGATE